MSHRWPGQARVGVLAGTCALASACAAVAPPAAPASPQAIPLTGSSAPPLLVVLSIAQAARLPALSFTYGPSYQRGRILSLVITYPGCEQIRGATVTETTVAVRVRVLGALRPANCVSSRKVASAAVRLPVPLGRRTRIRA